MSINYTDNNTIIFTLARMNPPTPGHLYIIRRLIQEAINKDVNNVYVILSKTNDNNENPISCQEKINVLGNIEDITKTMINSEKLKMIEETENPEVKSKIEFVNVHAICVPDRKGATPFTPLFDIIVSKKNIPDLNLFLIIGDDRKNMLDSITDFFFKKLPNVNSIDGIITPREEMSQYKELSKDPAKLDALNMSDVIKNNGMSASFVRNVVRNNRLDKFTELYSPFLDESKIPELFEAIKIGIETLPPNKKKDNSVSGPLKYNYPMIKNIDYEETMSSKRNTENIDTSEKQTKKRRTKYGGKRTKRVMKKKNKSRKNKNRRNSMKK
jgi:nicotinic acid mononucleotide adenylyltransferase